MDSATKGTLAAGIIFIVIFLVSWLVFHRTGTMTWISLLLGIFNLGYAAYTASKGKNNK